MSETKFTKGEWAVEDGKVVVCDGFKVAYAYSGSNIPLTSEINANAHIIASAPKMHEMLSKINNIINSGLYEIELADAIHGISGDIESLLAKARGEK